MAQPLSTDPQHARLAVVSAGDDPSLHARAAHLAAELGLPLAAEPPPHLFYIVVTPERLELHAPAAARLGPVFVDFVGGRAGYARRVPGARLLLRAVGAQPGLRVLDATAGLGQDTFWLAHAGCHVTAVERDPIVHVLLRDGLERAALAPDLHAVVTERIRLVHGDARAVLRDPAGDTAPDVVYVDTMFPAKKKAALGKKEMRILRDLVGDDDDAAELLAVAREVARRHVVVKRLRLAAPVAADPTRTYVGQSTRYDVYAAPMRV